MISFTRLQAEPGWLRSRYYKRVGAVRTTTYSVSGSRVSLILSAMIVLAPMSAAAQSPRAADDAANRIVALDPRWTVVLDTAPAAPAGFRPRARLRPAEGRRTAGDRSESRPGEMESDAHDRASPRQPATGSSRRWRRSHYGARAAQRCHDLADAARGCAGHVALLGCRLADRVARVGRSRRPSRGWTGRSSGASRSVPQRRPRRRPRAIHVHVALRDGRLVSLTLSTGVTAWTTPLNEPVTGHFGAERPTGRRHARQSRLQHLSLDRGRIRWSQRAGADIAGAPVADERLIYYAALDNMLRAVDRKSGNLRWARQLGRVPPPVHFAPATSSFCRWSHRHRRLRRDDRRGLVHHPRGWRNGRRPIHPRGRTGRRRRC